jgi:hypothetical protein
MGDRAGRGLRDWHTGKLTRYLFMRHGKLLSAPYLFEDPLSVVCEGAGIVVPEDQQNVTAHRFRHTVGRQMAEKGARTDTIMKLLGHKSSGMTMVYAQISDRKVLKDYRSVLGPGAAIAGPLADALRQGAMPDSGVEWVKRNFFKTELELGHCLRLPQEGPCECDLFLTCPRFVTTAEHAPRLKQRRAKELELIKDAAGNGWEREVERHRCTVRRIDQLLEELGEPDEYGDTSEQRGRAG